MKYTEEENKAIEDLRKTINYYNKRFEENEKITAVLVDNFDVENLFVLLNLVEKQQKEIERLKEYLIQYHDGKLFTSNQLKRIEKEQNKYYIHKDKIREKIEEYAGLKEIDIKAYDEQVKPLKELLGE